jgi:hypothetical protein
VELDPKLIEFVENPKEVLRASGQPITGPNEDGVETMAMRIFEESVQSRPPNLGAADAVIYILFNNVVATLSSKLAQFDALCLGVLVECRHAKIKRGTFHAVTSI